MDHLPASALDFLVIGANVIILLFLLRLVAGRYKDTTFGKGLAALI